ncbi:hypothetical protein D929_02472, partial [Enterococcus faecalis 02-MB-P-10]
MAVKEVRISPPEIVYHYQYMLDKGADRKEIKNMEKNHMRDPCKSFA